MKQFDPFIHTVVSITVALVLVNFAGCGVNDPAKTVTIEITGIPDDADQDAVKETLKGMTDGSSHMISSTSINDTMTINLSPVSDVDAFVRKVNFGEVTEVNGRTVKVTYVE